MLNSLDITVEEVRAQVARIVGRGDGARTRQIPFTPRSKKVLELALREALSLGHNYIGTEHILLGLVRENEGVAARILLDFDADAEKIRAEILRMLPGRTALRETTRRRRQPSHWDYTVVALEGPPAEWERQLVAMGKDGWELVAIAEGHGVFKRAQRDGPSIRVVGGTARD